MTRFLIPVAAMILVVTALAQDSAQHKPSAAIPSASSNSSRHLVPSTLTDGLALPAGTSVRMRLETAISTGKNQRGDRFGGRVIEAVMMNGKTIIPVGSAIEGEVMKVDEPRRFRGRPTIDLHPQAVVLPDGTRYYINAVVVDTNYRPMTDVNDEGQVKGQGRDRGDNIELAAGTAGGALIGGLAAGGKGLLIGAGVGATATAIHWLTKRNSTELPAGTEIFMELSRPMALSSVSAGQ